MAGPAMSHDFGESLGYLISDPGRTRARDVLARDHYIGPAPVPFGQYEASVRAQVSQADVTAAWLTRALQHLTLSPDLLVQLGPPVNARAPLFLYGAPGNGKTTIAEALGRAPRRTDLHSVLDRHRGPGDAALRSAPPPAREPAAADELRHPVGLREASLRQSRWRADHRPAIAIVRSLDALLRGAHSPESQRRHLPARRLRPPGL